MADPIQAARNDLMRRTHDYNRRMQAPLHLTGELRTPKKELGDLQEIFKALLILRYNIIEVNELYRCLACHSAEGEFHASSSAECPQERVTRPPGWTRKCEPAPVEFPADHVEQRCPEPGCIYLCLPGAAACAQHGGEEKPHG